MDIRDIMMEPTGIQRPDHPDFWKLSEIILALKADTEEFSNGKITQEEATRRWEAHYASVGDTDSIQYAAVQCGLQLAGIETGADWQAVMANPANHNAFVKTIQAYFDGFIMGALLERSRHE